MGILPLLTAARWVTGGRQRRARVGLVRAAWTRQDAWTQVVVVGKGDREQIWKTGSEYFLSTLFMTSDLTMSAWSHPCKSSSAALWSFHSGSDRITPCFKASWRLLTALEIKARVFSPVCRSSLFSASASHFTKLLFHDSPRKASQALLADVLGN